MIVGLFYPSQRNNHTKTVYYGLRYGSVGYYIIHADRVCPVEKDEIMGWYRYITMDDISSGVRGHLEPRKIQLELF